MIWPSLSDPTIENRTMVLTKRLYAKAAQSSEKTHLVRNNELLMDVEDRRNASYISINVRSWMFVVRDGQGSQQENKDLVSRCYWRRDCKTY